MTWIVTVSPVRHGIKTQMKTISKLHVDRQHFYWFKRILFYLYKEISFERSI